MRSHQNFCAQYSILSPNPQTIFHGIIHLQKKKDSLNKHLKQHKHLMLIESHKEHQVTRNFYHTRDTKEHAIDEFSEKSSRLAMKSYMTHFTLSIKTSSSLNDVNLILSSRYFL